MTEVFEALKEASKDGSSIRIRNAVDRWMTGTLTDTELADVASIETSDSQHLQDKLSVHEVKT